MKWFKDVHTLDELRTMYRKLALLHHPDRGGSTADMQDINNEYVFNFWITLKI
jgi:DnaJ-class molecular chaperone